MRFRALVLVGVVGRIIGRLAPVPASDGAELQVGKEAVTRNRATAFCFFCGGIYRPAGSRERGQRASRVSGRARRIQRGGRAAAAARTPSRARTRPSTRCSTPCTTGAVSLGVVPIENSIGGSIHRNYDLLVERELSIVGEVQVPVVHQLLALPGVRLEEVRRVLSHPQALAQCARFLREPRTRRSDRDLRHGGQREDGARRAAARTRRRSPRSAPGTVRPRGAAQRASRIRRQHHAVPRHLRVSARRCGRPTRPASCSRCSNEPGALFKALSVFALRGIDLSKLESRPVAGPAVGVPVLRRRRRRSRRICSARAPWCTSPSSPPSLRTLGSYPRWREPDEARATERAGVAKRAERATWLTTPRPHRPLKWQSGGITDGPSRAACARDAARRPASRRADLARPVVGVANTWIEIGPVQLPSARAGGVGQGRHPRGRRHADGVQHRLDLRRHHDGHRPGCGPRS